MLGPVNQCVNKEAQIQLHWNLLFFDYFGNYIII